MFETKKQQVPGLLLLIDFEKAFDTVSWKFITKALKIFNFGDSIIKWVNLFYSNANSCIIQNGFISEFFTLGRGCRQGDPLSPYIFLLCAEILGILMRNNKNIKGIVLNDKEFKIIQYADDTALILDGSEISLKIALKTLSLFYKISGLKMNMDKTKAVWIGSVTNSNLCLCSEYKIQWVNEFELLGIKFSNNLSNICELNFRDKLNEIQSCIRLWKWRSLTLIGKITIIKSLLISKLNHLFLALPSPEPAIIKEIEKLIFKFLWNNKPDKIKRSYLYRQYDLGGLKMVNITEFIKSLKLSWLKRYHLQDVKWKVFFR